MLSRFEVVEQAEERTLPRIPSQETIDVLSACAYDLGRYIYDGVAIGRKVHAQ